MTEGIGASRKASVSERYIAPMRDAAAISQGGTSKVAMRSNARSALVIASRFAAIQATKSVRAHSFTRSTLRPPR
jgi:hypothetical protein